MKCSKSTQTKCAYVSELDMFWNEILRKLKGGDEVSAVIVVVSWLLC